MDSTPVVVHFTLSKVIETLQAAGVGVEVIDGPLGPPLPPDETDDGRDLYVDDLLADGLAEELSWIVVEQLVYGALRNG